MAFYKKTDDDTWAAGKEHFVKTTTGWKRGIELYRKSGASTWTMEESWDITPPGAPTLVGLTTNSATRTVTITAKMPGDTDLSHATLKFWLNGYVVTEAGDGNIYPDTGNVGRQAASAYQNITWTFKPQYYDRKFYVSIWAVDDNGLTSSALRTTFTIASPTVAPAPTSPTVSKYTYNAVTSGTYDNTNNFWNIDYYGKLVVQSGAYDHAGGWMYNGKIRSALSTKDKINKFTIKITRASSAHGVSGAADVYLIPHKQDVVGSGATPALYGQTAPVYVGTLERGQTKTFNVPSAWWSGFLSGTYRGLGIYYGSATAWTSNKYVIAYGAGTTSGQVYIEAQ